MFRQPSFRNNFRGTNTETRQKKGKEPEKGSLKLHQRLSDRPNDMTGQRPTKRQHLNTIEQLKKNVEEQEKKLFEQNQEIARLTAQLKSKKWIKETISEKVAKHMLVEKGQFSLPASSSSSTVPGLNMDLAATSSSDYRQAILLSKINCYLSLAHKEAISEKGYCHGLVLLWLTMLSWGVESLFFAMIKIIAECPVDELVKIESVITLFLDWIEVGQQPQKYSNQAYTQQNLVEIIGEVNQIFAISKNFSREDLRKQLRKLKQEENMMAVTGWWPDQETKMKAGHTVGVFIQNNNYHFYDPNDDKLGGEEFVFVTDLVNEIWDAVFSCGGLTKSRIGEFSLNVVHRIRPSPTKHYSSAVTFFSPTPSAPSQQSDRKQELKSTAFWSDLTALDEDDQSPSLQKSLWELK